MPFTKVYTALLTKAEKKGRTRDEVHEVASWLAGYSQEQIEEYLKSDLNYAVFFRVAPVPNPDRTKIAGSVRGIRLESEEDPLMRDIRHLDEARRRVAKGKHINKVIRI